MRWPSVPKHFRMHQSGKDAAASIYLRTHSKEVANAIVWRWTERRIDVEELQAISSVRTREKVGRIAHQCIALLPAKLFPQELNDGLKAIEGSDPEVVVFHDGCIANGLEADYDFGRVLLLVRL